MKKDAAVAATDDFLGDFADMTPEEARADLSGPAFTLQESATRVRAKFPQINWEALDKMTDAERAEQAEREIAALPAATRARLGYEGV